MKKIIVILLTFIHFIGYSIDNIDRVKTCPPKGGNQSGPQGSGGSEQTDPAPAKGAGLQIPVVAPVDPNEIIGPQGYVDADSLRWVSTDATLGYTIYFENDPEFATANAQRVEIRHTLDENADIYSFGLGSFGFGNMVFSIEDAPAIYQTRLDVRDSLGIYVDVVAGVDVSKREIFWLFSSIDPATNLPPLEADKGFLPVNDKEKHNGEGYVSFVMKAKSGIASGDSIKAQASIVFDTNEAIPTNVWKNTLDGVAPTSTFTAEQQKDRPTFYDFRFNAKDDQEGSGVRQVTVYLSRNKAPYEEYAVCRPDSIWKFEAESGSEYAFYTQAEDFAGNKEELKDKADFTIQMNGAPTDLFLSAETFQDDIAVDGFIGELSSEDTGGDDQVFTYALAEGEGAIHNDLFRIEGNRLLAGATFRCATETEYKIRIQTTDAGGLTFSKAFVLTMKHVLTNPEPLTMEVGICEGESYDFFGTRYSETGTYTYRKENEAMCDSVYILNLRVDPIPAKPSVTVSGNRLTSSALDGNQWFDEFGPISGATEQSFTPSVSGNYFVVVSNGGCESEPSDTYYVNMSGDHQVAWNLRSGWNWISVNLKSMTDPVAFLRPVQDQTERMLGQSQELTKDPVYGLVGELKTLVPSTSYKLRMSSGSSLTWGGEAFSAEEVAIALKRGWNWLGYVPTVELTPDVAFAEARPMRDDIIKGQTGFSSYDGTRWIGSLQQLKPGEGYMYYSGEDKTFHYSTAQATVLRNTIVNMDTENNVWNYDPYKYPDNMGMIAVVYNEDMKMEPGIYSVGAFAGDECRGVGVYVDGYLFMTVYGGTKGESISFKALENATGEELAVKETVRFGEETIGTLSQPFVLHVTNSSSVDVEGIEDIYLTVYPNPVRSLLNIGGDYHLVKSVTVLNLNGVPVIRKTLNGNSQLDMSMLSNGAYIVALETEKGFVYRKVLKSSNAKY